MKRAGYRFLRTTFSPSIRMLWPTKVFGKENLLKDGRAIFVSNHLSNLDPLAIGIRLFKKDFNAIGKEELFKSKFSTSFFNTLGIISVKRGEADIAAVKKVLKLLNAERQLLIFPEGTRNKGDAKELLPLKSGVGMFAAKTKSPIIPLLFYKKYKLLTKNYLLVGKAISIDEFSDIPASEAKEKITERVTAEMMKMRLALDDFVEGKNKNAIKLYFGEIGFLQEKNEPQNEKISENNSDKATGNGGNNA